MQDTQQVIPPDSPALNRTQNRPVIFQPPQRDASGRFQPGCKPGPGRPPRDREAAWQRAFASALSPGELQAVVASMVCKAKSGNVSAARLLIEHAIGKPAIKIAFADPSEFRVAGLRPDEVIDDQLEKLAERIREVRERETMIRRGEQPAPEPMPSTPQAEPTIDLQDAARRWQAKLGDDNDTETDDWRDISNEE